MRLPATQAKGTWALQPTSADGEGRVSTEWHQGWSPPQLATWHAVQQCIVTVPTVISEIGLLLWFEVYNYSSVAGKVKKGMDQQWMSQGVGWNGLLIFNWYSFSFAKMKNFQRSIHYAPNFYSEPRFLYSGEMTSNSFLTSGLLRK